MEEDEAKKESKWAKSGKKEKKTFGAKNVYEKPRIHFMTEKWRRGDGMNGALGGG